MSYNADYDYGSRVAGPLRSDSKCPPSEWEIPVGILIELPTTPGRNKRESAGKHLRESRPTRNPSSSSLKTDSVSQSEFFEVRVNILSRVYRLGNFLLCCLFLFAFFALNFRTCLQVPTRVCATHHCRSLVARWSLIRSPFKRMKEGERKRKRI